MRANSKPVHRARHRAAHRVSRVATSPPNQTNLAACFRCRSRSRRLITPHGGVHTWKACGRLFFCLYYSQHVNLLLIPLRDFWYATHFHRNPSVDAHTRPERVAHVRIVRTQFFPLSTHGEQSSCDTMSAPQAPVKLRNGVVKQVRTRPRGRRPISRSILAYLHAPHYRFQRARIIYTSCRCWFLVCSPSWQQAGCGTYGRILHYHHCNGPSCALKAIPLDICDINKNFNNFIPLACFSIFFIFSWIGVS